MSRERNINGQFAKGHSKVGGFTKQSKHIEESKKLISESLSGKFGDKARRWKGEAMGLIKKFRAWDNINKEWLNKADSDNLIICLDGSYEINRGWVAIKPDLTIEQYTGLKDKNGEEIYEGDIVLDCYDGEDAFIVEWDKDTASFILTGVDHIASVSFDNFYTDKDLEVIGNIHENPEFLEGKK